jgi:N-acetylated-alpha-linked acidic dipeptidase
MRVEALQPSSHDPAAVARIKADAKIAADPKKDFPIEALGSGSDYSTFIEHLGVPALSIEYGDEGSSGGVYHSRYDTYEHYTRFGDPGFVYEAVLAKTVSRLIMRAADADLPVQQAGDFADTISGYVTEVKKLADDKREAAQTQAKMLADHAFQLAADPTKSSGLPTPLLAVPKIDFAALDKAVARLKTSAAAYDAAFAKNALHLAPGARARLQALMQTLDQTLAPDVGLPMRPWFKNLIYAPGRFTGYGAKTLPGVREAIEDERFADAVKYIGLTAGVLDAYSARLDQATAVLNGK